MKSLIFEFLEPTNQEKKKLWQNAIFVFDTNVLLNLYRYSTKTRSTLLKAIKSFEKRVWIPHQVALEFMNRRCEIIFESVERYNKILDEYKKYKKICKQALRLKEDDNEIAKLDKYVEKWIRSQKENNLLVSNPNEDEILSILLDTFDGKVGKPYNDEKYQQVIEEGEKRYNKLIPPGFKDKIKKNTETNNSFGDYIIWTQIIGYAKENRKDIVFVTHDQKEDWWNIQKGKTIGPRIELRKEFNDATDKKFHMYSMNGFIERLDEDTVEKIDQSIIDEVKNMEYELYNISKNELIKGLEKDIINLSGKLYRKEQSISQLESKYHNKKMPKNVKLQIERTRDNASKIIYELDGKKDEYMRLGYNVNKLI